MYYRRRKFQKNIKNNNFIESIKKYNILKNTLLLFSIVSVNFAGFIAYYDINIFMLVDSTTIIKYVFSLLIQFALISAAITLILLILEKYTFSILGYMDEKKFSNIFKMIHYPLIIVSFSFVYVGWQNTMITVFVFLVYFYVIFIGERLQKNSISLKNISKRRNLNIENLILEYFLFFKRVKIMVQTGESIDLKDFVFSKFGFMLLLLALLTGYGRASFVNNRSYVKLNTDKDVYVLFLNTNNGIFLFNKKNNEVFYTSNEKISKLIFIKDARRNFTLE